ncbi:dynein axonemal assembly factor 5-like [Salvelinus fontinalis]|uniref:dynein axonemal assembly factor 5-like n=2 Tax=Salvelinus fontinalis TaxID=8038 RepID=UPI002485F17A|nr:dynein axonemal assembly factor 5-like [Salvelinus fontinalis]
MFVSTRIVTIATVKMATTMAAGEERAASEVLRALARHLNCLNEDSKTTRKRALEAIKRETIDKGLSSGVLQEVFTCLLKSLLKCLSDPMERCRETAIHMLGDFIRCVPQPEDSLPYLMPALTQRLGGKEILEPAEELRLSMVEVLTLTVEVCGRHLAPYLDDMMKILQRTIVDPFPDVKRESCKCTVHFAKSVPEHFHMQAESLVKPLMQTISHQHSRVRVSTIEATGAVIQYGTGKNVDDVLSHLAQRLFDDSPQVRKAVTVVVGDWLLHLRDRYSYFHKLIPLLLSSLSDDIPEISQRAADLWRQTGALWEQENEDDLKDKMDFLLTPPDLYPAGVARPGLGCRELVVRNLSNLLPALARDVVDWVAGTRVKTAQLLYALLLHAEDHCTQHLQLLLSTLYRACNDPESDVVTNCLRSAKLLGTFVSPEVFLKLLLVHLETPSSSPHTPLMVLAAVLGGCSRDLLKPHLQKIADTLVQPDVCQEYQQAVYLDQLLSCVDVLLSVCEKDCCSVSLQLLQVLVTVQSLSTEPLLTDKAEQSVVSLCKVQVLPTVADLYRQHMNQLLQWLSASQKTWTSYSPQRLQLQVIATQSGPVIGEFLPLLMPLLQNCLDPERDPEMRLHMFTMLSKLLLDATHTLDSQGRFCEHLDVFLLELLLPNLVWKAGSTAAAIRTSALSCLLALLQGGAIPPSQLLAVEERLSPQVLSALEEDSQLSRLLACRSLSTLLKLIGPSLHPDALNNIYPEVLKRLDDSSEEVRGVALRALGLWLASLGKDYNSQLYSQHLEVLFQQLLLHLDDPDSRVQDTVLEVLKTGSGVHPALLKQEVEAVRDKQRTPVYCDQLLQHIHSLRKDTV